MYEVETGAGDLDSGDRDFCRTVEFVERFTSADWWMVVDGSNLVPPPADPKIGTVYEGGVVSYLPGGLFQAEPASRGFVPEDMDHVGAHALVLVPVLNEPGPIGMPRCYWVKEDEQLVIRERVAASAINHALRLLVLQGAPAEGQRVSAGTTAAEPTPGHEACDLDRTCSGGPYKCLQDPSWNDMPGQTTEQLPSSKIPIGVAGERLGRLVAESAAVNFTSRRDSDEAEN